MANMVKITIQKELICPFEKCRFAYGQDKEGNELFKDMDVRCESCKFAWKIKSTVLGYPVTVYENSKE